MVVVIALVECSLVRQSIFFVAEPQGQFGKPGEGDRLPLEAVMKHQAEKT